MLICDPLRAQENRQLTVAAAANLTTAFAEVAKAFQAKSGIAIVYSFGATANLAMQAEHSAPFDVFAAADVEHIEDLDRKHLLVPDSAAVYARGKLVLWVPPHSMPAISKIDDLAKPGIVHVAIANPSLAPYGAAAVESLRKLGLWEKVEPKVVYSPSISAAKQYAETGNTEAAFIAYSLVFNAGGRIIRVPEELHAPIDQSIAILRSSSHQADARKFVDFVLGDEGRDILMRYGYDLPKKR